VTRYDHQIDAKEPEIVSCNHDARYGICHGEDTGERNLSRRNSVREELMGRVKRAESRSSRRTGYVTDRPRRLALIL